MIELEPVRPALPVAPWQGGKRNLARRIIARIEAIPHDGYAEAFVGMGGVFLRRSMRPKVEVINDLSEDVSTFFRVLQHHYVAFLDMLRFQVSSRANFEKLIRMDPASLTDLHRSARFLYLQRLAFGGRVTGSRTFGVAPSNPGRFDVTKLGPMLEALHERLAGVVIERMDWGDFIARYDRDGMLFYLDPPYWGCEDDYGRAMFSRDDFARLAAVLGQIKGRFLLSLNDRPEVRETFAAFDMEAVEARYSIAGMAKSRMFGELIISN